jgi:glycosyltransferase involved in cell wall biosynthesis
MKICIFAKGLPVHITGGMEIHIEGLVDGLIKRGHSVCIITARHPEGIEKEEKENLTVYYLKSKPKYTRERFYRESAKLFEELNKRENFDIVHSQSTLASGYTKYCKKTIPLVLTSHGTALNEIKTVLNGSIPIKSFFAIPIWLKIYLLDEPIIFKKSDKIIAVSNELGEDLKKQCKVPEKKLVIIPNGIDTDKFKPFDASELKKKYGIENERIILCTGRIEKIKGFHLLLKVISEIEDTRLFVVGTGSYLDNLKKMSMDLNIEDKVIFTGKVPEEELIQLYNLADLFIHPTLWFSEAFGLVLAEAMACGKPVIASKIGGIPTVIDSYKDGILFEPGDLNALKEKILEVLNDESLSKRLGENARKKVIQRFSLDRMVEDTIRVYKELKE